MRRRLGLLEPGRHHGTLGARVQALAATHAGALVDHMDKPRLALDGVLLARIQALPAASAARDQDVVRDQRAALPRRALVARDVCLELVAKESKRLGGNVGHALANLAECLLCHRGRKVTNEVEVSVLPLTGASVSENRAELVAALVAKDAPPAALAVEVVEDLSHGVNGTVARANHACLVAGKGDGIAKVRGHHKGTHGIAQVNGLDIVSANACGAEKLGNRGLCGALYTGVAHVDHLALAAAEPRLAGHERVHVCGGSAHGRGQVYHYCDYAYVQMLGLTNTQYNLLNFVHPSLMRLARYDRDHGTELMDTLFIYLQNACNTQRAAKMLNLHKNTLLYRMGRIREILGCNLSSGEDQFMLQLSYRVLFYLDLFKSRISTSRNDFRIENE